ncbi:hypothetical protein GEMRC1_009742 [Eukaryota sp. GEM-RC1]
MSFSTEPLQPLTWIDCFIAEDLSVFLKKHLHHPHDLSFLPYFLCHRLPFFHWNQKSSIGTILGLPHSYRSGGAFTFRTLKSKHRGIIRFIKRSFVPSYTDLPSQLRDKIKQCNTQSVDHFLSRVSYSDSFDLFTEMLFRLFFPDFEGSTPEPTPKELNAINYLLGSIKVRTVYHLSNRIDRFIGAFILLLKEPVHRKGELDDSTTESELFKTWEDLVNDSNRSRDLLYDQIIDMLNSWSYEYMTPAIAFRFLKESYELLDSMYLQFNANANQSVVSN